MNIKNFLKFIDDEKVNVYFHIIANQNSFVSNSASQSMLKVIDDNILKNFEKFFLELKLWNKKFNLTGLKNDKEIFINLFLDSLQFLKLNIVSQCETILDVGSGAGFPGVPNAILLKNKSFILIDSNKKKCLFLENIKNKLKLNNITIFNNRADELGKNDTFREKYDCALIKAFAPFSISMEISVPLIKINGFIVYYASKNQEKDIINNNKLQKNLGFNIVDVCNYELPENYGKRCLVIVKKLWKTDSFYPRKYKNIKLKPL